MPKRATERKVKRGAPRAGNGAKRLRSAVAGNRRRIETLEQRLSNRERIESLEHRVSAIEATLNGRLARLELRIENIGEGLRANVAINSAIVLELQESRELRGRERSSLLKTTQEIGEAWLLKPST